MKRFLQPNIGSTGRWIRGVLGVMLALVGLGCLWVNLWLALLMLVSAALVLFEASRGWCVARACGVRTRW
jgi:hypothetical protein